MYLSYTGVPGHYNDIVVLQGNSIINTFPEAYGSPFEILIAVYGDVRATGYDFFGAGEGGQYTLSGVPTGTSYVLPAAVAVAYDSTSDGSHNYLVDWNTGTVYQTARDYTNATALFNTGRQCDLGITHDAANKSLWISSWSGTTVANYSLSGTLLSSFSTGHDENAALALDPADHTLWLIDDEDRLNYLLQYSLFVRQRRSLACIIWIAQHPDGNLIQTSHMPVSGQLQVSRPSARNSNRPRGGFRTSDRLPIRT